MVRLIKLDTGQELTLKPGTTIPLELNSPIQADTETPGSKSYTFNLPHDEVNLAELGFLNNPQSTASRKRSWPVMLVDEGQNIMRGLLKVRSLTEKGSVTNVTGSVGAFSETLRGRNMTELDELGEETLSTTPVTINLFYIKAPLSPEVCDYQLPGAGVGSVFRFKDITGGQTKSINYSGTLEQTLKDLAAAVNIDDNYPMVADAKGQTFQIVPDTGTRVCKLYIQTDYHDDVAGMFKFVEWEEELEQLTFDSIAPYPDATTGRTGTNAADKFVFPQVYNPAFYPTENAIYSGYVNNYVGGHYQHNSAQAVSRETLTPMFFMFWVIRKLVELQGYTAEGDLFDDEDLAQLVIYNTRSIDLQSTELETPFNAFQTTIRYADHMPDMSVGEFLNAVTGVLGVQMFFQEREKVVRFMFMKEILAAPASEDWSLRTSPAFSSEETDEKVIKLAFTLSDSDETQKGGGGIFASYKPDGALDTDVTDTIEFPLSSLEMTTQAGRQLPTTKQAGISPLFSLESNKSPLRLLFWKGLQTDDNGAQYPAASNELNGKKLQWNGEGGLFETYWSQYHAFKTSTSPTEKQVDFTAVQLASLDFEKKVWFAGLTWLPVQVSASLPLTKRAKVVFYRC